MYCIIKCIVQGKQARVKNADLRHPSCTVVKTQIGVTRPQCANNKYAVINNNYGTLKELILIFKIPMDTRKVFFEIYRQFGHAPSKTFASPGLTHSANGSGYLALT